MPLRTSVWSSARSTRSRRRAHDAVSQSGCRASSADAAARRRADRQPAAERGDALAHAEPAHVRAGVGGDAAAVVLDRSGAPSRSSLDHAHARVGRRRAWRATLVSASCTTR